jgi:serine/threonine protein kinase
LKFYISQFRILKVKTTDIIKIGQTYFDISWIRYVVQEMLGQGTFGQVAKCWDAETNSYVAVKVIKNQPAFYQQAIMEVSLLRLVW